MIAVITLATFLILVVILRALPLAAIAVVLNLVTVAVAFGVLTLLFEVPQGWPLGGHTYVDAIGAAGIFGIIFGLSIDYAVFLLMRMREHYESGASNEEAIRFGLEKHGAGDHRRGGDHDGGVRRLRRRRRSPRSASSASGSTVAVLLDATVVRIVLLPALMLLLGDGSGGCRDRCEKILPRDRSSRLPRGLGSESTRNSCIFCHRVEDRGRRREAVRRIGLRNRRSEIRWEAQTMSLSLQLAGSSYAARRPVALAPKGSEIRLAPNTSKGVEPICAEESEGQLAHPQGRQRAGSERAARARRQALHPRRRGRSARPSARSSQCRSRPPTRRSWASGSAT